MQPAPAPRFSRTASSLGPAAAGDRRAHPRRPGRLGDRRRRRASRERRRRPGLRDREDQGRAAVPLPRHPRRGRRRRQRVRRGAALRGARRGATYDGCASSATRSARSTSRTSPASCSVAARSTSATPWTPSRSRSSAPRPSSASSRSARSRRTSRSSAPATASASSAPSRGGLVDRTYAEPISALPITLTEAGRADPLLGVLPPTFDAFLGHKEAVTRLPRGAVRLAASPTCPVHAFRIGTRVYATQFHPELDVEGLVPADRDLPPPRLLRADGGRGSAADGARQPRRAPSPAAGEVRGALRQLTDIQ